MRASPTSGALAPPSDGKAWVFDGVYVAPDRVDQGSKGKNTGCL